MERKGVDSFIYYAKPGLNYLIFLYYMKEKWQLIAFKTNKDFMPRKEVRVTYIFWQRETQERSKINLISLKDELPSPVDALLKINVR